MENDPYATPNTNLQPSGLSGNAAVSQGVIQQLAKTKPWVRLVSVMLFVVAALTLLAALAMAFMGSAIASAAKNPMFSGGMGVVLALIYGIFAFLYIFPAVKLWKYASRIGILMTSGETVDLETALNEQRSFWKFVGVLVLIVLSIYALIFLGVIVMGGIGAMAGSR